MSGFDISGALKPKSDQLDFVDLEGLPPQVFTITDVTENGTELAEQQPVNIKLAEFPRVWRPSKGMLRVLADNWSKVVEVWVGRKVELYGDPNVYFGKEKRGGTRISRLSHISQQHTTLVNPRGGRNAYWTVDPLPESAPTSTETTLPDRIEAAVAAYARASVTVPMLEARVARPLSEWDEGNLAELQTLYAALMARETTKDAEFTIDEESAC